MARAIDLDQLLQYPLRRGSEHCDEENADPHFLNGVESVLEWAQTLPTLTPQNEPLTIEQLREMDGEPVWIVDVGPHKWYGPGWAIVDRDNCLVRTAKNWNPVFFERYGERWLAYRRPKEEQ